FDPQGMIRMFNRLTNASRLNEGMGGGGYTSTHPLSIQRMSDIQNRVSEMPNVSRSDSDSFWYIRAKLRVAQARDSQAQRNAIARFELDTQQKKGAEQSAAWYGLAYSAWLKQDYAGAAKALDAAVKTGRGSPEVAGLQV